MSRLAGAAEALRLAREARERESTEGIETGPVWAVVRIEEEEDRRLAAAEARFWREFMAAAAPRQIRGGAS